MRRWMTALAMTMLAGCTADGGSGGGLFSSAPACGPDLTTGVRGNDACFRVVTVASAAPKTLVVVLGEAAVPPALAQPPLPETTIVAMPSNGSADDVGAAVKALRTHHQVRRAVLVARGSDAALAGRVATGDADAADGYVLVECPCDQPDMVKGVELLPRFTRFALIGGAADERYAAALRARGIAVRNLDAASLRPAVDQMIAQVQ